MNRPTATARVTRPGPGRPSPRPSRRAQLVTVAIALLAVGALFLAFRSGQAPASTAGPAGTNPPAGQPGIGQSAPPFTLAAGVGTPVSLSDYRGRNVLLFFQEGIGCQPCWDQVRDLEADSAALRQAGIDDVVSITTSPADLVAQKVRDDHLSTPVLSDPDLAVSRQYAANRFGMMGTSRDGHSFMLVGPDGTIRWRADYGGAPDYTMYLPVDRMLADMRRMMGTRPMPGEATS